MIVVLIAARCGNNPATTVLLCWSLLHFTGLSPTTVVRSLSFYRGPVSPGMLRLPGVSLGLVSRVFEVQCAGSGVAKRVITSVTLHPNYLPLQFRLTLPLLPVLVYCRDEFRGTDSNLDFR